MEYELMELIENGAAVSEIGEWLSIYGKKYWNGKCFCVNGMRIYPIYNRVHSVVGFEYD